MNRLVTISVLFVFFLLFPLVDNAKAESVPSINAETIEGINTSVVELSKGVFLGNQLKQPNTTYEIYDDFDLQNKKVIVPSNCTLVFRGGKIFNGTLDLNNCSIEGSGLCCNILRPKDQSYPLSYFLSDVKDPKLNRNIVQCLLDSKVPVIIDFPELTFDNYLSVKNTAIVQSYSDRRSILNFPNSRGFVWDGTGYSANNCFEALVINSKGTAFDFSNGGSNNRPRNVYLSDFRRLRVNSKEGNCFDAGVANLGSTGDSCTFDNLFESIEVSAPKGSGFVGLSSNTQHFTKVRCLGCGVAFFYNCAGVFDSCNGTWGNTTPTFYKGTRRDSKTAARYSCIFRNCNIESYQSVLFDCRDVMCYMELAFENCSFYITPNPNKTIDYFPFDFGVLFSLRIRNTKFNYYNDGKFDKEHTLFRIGSPSNISNFDLDQNITVTDNNSYSYTVFGKRANVNSSVSQSTYNKVVFDEVKNADIDLLRVKSILPTITSLQVKNTKPTQSMPLALGDDVGSFYNLTCSIDEEGGVVSLQYPQIPSWLNNYYTYVPWQFYLRNANKHAKIVIKNNLANGKRFCCETNQDIVLKPGETVNVKYITKNISGDKEYLLVSPVISQTSFTQNQVGSQRPANPQVGFQFFDRTLGYPIWWNGNNWVDSSGKTVRD